MCRTLMDDEDKTETWRVEAEIKTNRHMCVNDCGRLRVMFVASFCCKWTIVRFEGEINFFL